MDPEIDLTQLSEFWSDVRGSAVAAELENELSRETSAGHILADIPVVAVAVRKLRKEVVYLLPEGRWAWVHLTWSMETDPRWPATTIVDTWGNLVGTLQEGERG